MDIAIGSLNHSKSLLITGVENTKKKIPMKIDLYSVVKDEMVLLPYFFRHYETFVNRFLIWDDHSTDGTLEFLKAHPKVILLDMGKYGLDNGYHVRKLFPQYRKLSKGHADWVIVADADEFVYHPRMIRLLKRCYLQGIQRIKCSGYSMYSDTLPTTSGQIYDEIRIGTPDRMFSKTAIFQSNILISYVPGRHRCRARTPEGIVATQYPWKDVKLFHYRYFGLEYFEQRDRKNCENSGLKYIPNFKRYCPDRQRMDPIRWYRENKHKFKDVVSGI